MLDAAYDAGLSSPSRLHDLFVNAEAMTPGEFKAKGAGLKISYGFHPSPFGECLLAVTERGICGLGFVGEGGRCTGSRGLQAKMAGGRVPGEFRRRRGSISTESSVPRKETAAIL